MLHSHLIITERPERIGLRLSRTVCWRERKRPSKSIIFQGRDFGLGLANVCKGVLDRDVTG